jgi:hypothetical protein
MKLEDTRAAYETFSGKASDIVRQISLAGIGLIWLFRSGTATDPLLDIRLLRAALFIFLALLFDFLQYLAGTVIWYCYFRHKEKNNTKLSDEVLAPTWLNWPTWTLFYVKSAMMVIAYAVFIIPFLLSKFTP